MAIDLKQFAALQKASKASFFQQKKLVQQVLAGQVKLCEQCKQPLSLNGFAQQAHKAINANANEQPFSGIRCEKGCTDIQLDFA